MRVFCVGVRRIINISESDHNTNLNFSPELFQLTQKSQGFNQISAVVRIRRVSIKYETLCWLYQCMYSMCRLTGNPHFVLNWTINIEEFDCILIETKDPRFR